MTVRCEIAESPDEVHGAKNNERHVCGRRRDGEPAVSWRVEPREAEAYLKQYIEITRGEPARRPREARGRAWRSDESAIAAEVLMNNAG